MFKGILKRMIDEELELYRQQELLKMNARLLKDRADCVESRYHDEHDFHAGMEARNVQLARLDGEIKAKEAYLEKLEQICNDTYAKGEKEKGYYDILKNFSENGITINQ